MKNEINQTPNDIMQEKITRRVLNPLWSRDMAARVLNKRRSIRLRRIAVMASSLGIIVAMALIRSSDINSTRNKQLYSRFVNDQVYGTYRKALAYSPQEKPLRDIVTGSAVTEKVDVLIRESLRER